MCTYFISILCSVQAFCRTAACNNTPISVCLSHGSNTLVTVSLAQSPAPAHTRHLAADSHFATPNLVDIYCTTVLSSST